MDPSIKFPIVTGSIFVWHQTLVNVFIAPVGGLRNLSNGSMQRFCFYSDLFVAFKGNILRLNDDVLLRVPHSLCHL